MTKFWEDGVVVYNLDSGNTHLLNPIAGRALKCLAESPADVTGLARELAAQAGLEPDDELHENVTNLVKHLDSLGLIEPITA